MPRHHGAEVGGVLVLIGQRSVTRETCAVDHFDLTSTKHAFHQVVGLVVGCRRRTLSTWCPPRVAGHLNIRGRRNFMRCQILLIHGFGNETVGNCFVDNLAWRSRARRSVPSGDRFCEVLGVGKVPLRLLPKSDFSERSSERLMSERKKSARALPQRRCESHAELEERPVHYLHVARGVVDHGIGMCERKTRSNSRAQQKKLSAWHAFHEVVSRMCSNPLLVKVIHQDGIIWKITGAGKLKTKKTSEPERCLEPFMYFSNP